MRGWSRLRSWRRRPEGRKKIRTDSNRTSRRETRRRQAKTEAGPSKRKGAADHLVGEQTERDARGVVRRSEARNPRGGPKESARPRAVSGVRLRPRREGAALEGRGARRRTDLERRHAAVCGERRRRGRHGLRGGDRRRDRRGRGAARQQDCAHEGEVALVEEVGQLVTS